MAPIFRKVALKNLDAAEHMDHLIQVTTPQKWLILTGLALILASFAVWSVFGRITATSGAVGILTQGSPANPTDFPGAEILHALLYLPTPKAHQIRRGMAVRLVADGISKEHHGFLMGNVSDLRQVDPNRVDQGERTASWTQALKKEKAYTEIEVSLDKDVDSASGLRWTLHGGPPLAPEPGTRIMGEIVLYQKRPIHMIFHLRPEAGGLE